MFAVISCKNNTSKEKNVVVQLSIEEFHNAALNGDIVKIKEGLKSDIKFNATDMDGKNALMLAAFNGHTEIVKLLIKKGTKVNNKDSTGRTALMYASTGPSPTFLLLI
ncbi:ankyrin repeat domain-containing protein [Bacteroidota bacterium]